MSGWVARAGRETVIAAYDGQPLGPQGTAFGAHPPPSEPDVVDRDAGSGGTAEEARRGLRVLLGLLLAAPLVAVAWWSVTPLAPLRLTDRGVLLLDGADETAVAADGWFAVVAGCAGLVCALVVFSRIRRARVGALLGLTAGGLLGSVLAWQLGMLLGPGPIREQVRSLEPGSLFEAPLELSAKGVLFAWPLAAVIAYFALTAGLEPPPPRRGRLAAAAAMSPAPVQPDTQAGRRFPVTVLRPGYSVAEVDDFFRRLEAGHLSADQARAATFSSTRLSRGYDEEQVDAAIEHWASTR